MATEKYKLDRTEIKDGLFLLTGAPIRDKYRFRIWKSVGWELELLPAESNFSRSRTSAALIAKCVKITCFLDNKCEQN